MPIYVHTPVPPTTLGAPISAQQQQALNTHSLLERQADEAEAARKGGFWPMVSSPVNGLLPGLAFGAAAGGSTEFVAVCMVVDFLISGLNFIAATASEGVANMDKKRSANILKTMGIP